MWTSLGQGCYSGYCRPCSVPLNDFEDELFKKRREQIRRGRERNSGPLQPYSIDDITEALRDFIIT